VPWTPLSRPLAECRVALAGSGGVHLQGQQAFHFSDDTSIREIPADSDSGDLLVSHFGYPVGDARKDPNCVFPLERLRELADQGVIAGVAPTAFTFMGGIYSHRRVAEELIPALLDGLRSQEVDLFLLVPA
jgi:D-proline reductase (dithiol) PrdB